MTGKPISAHTERMAATLGATFVPDEISRPEPAVERGRADFLEQLRVVNAARWAEWAGEAGGTGSEDPLYQSNEFGGEAGEVLNIVKKLVREERGWRGSRSSVDKLADEIADCIICLDSIARAYAIDLADAVVSKFNATSLANGFPHRLSRADLTETPADGERAAVVAFGRRYVAAVAAIAGKGRLGKAGAHELVGQVTAFIDQIEQGLHVDEGARG